LIGLNGIFSVLVSFWLRNHRHVWSEGAAVRYNESPWVANFHAAYSRNI